MRLCSLRRETHRRPSRHRLPGRHDTTGCRRLLSGICCEPGAKTRYRRVPVIRAQPQIDGGTLVNAELFRSLIRVWRSFRANISPEVSCRRRVSRLPWRHASQAMDTIATMRCAALRFACGHNSQKASNTDCSISTKIACFRARSPSVDLNNPSTIMDSFVSWREVSCRRQFRTALRGE